MSVKQSQVDGLEPLERETTAGVIAERIRAGILSGLLAPGSQLVEAELASHFRVSRGPVREAIQRLVQEGLLENVRYRGVFVKELAVEDVQDVYLARRAIERAVVEKLVRDGGGGPIRPLARIVERMRRAAKGNDWEELSRLDLSFHEALVAASGSERLQRMFATLIIETSICVSALKPNYPRPTELAEEHATLVEAIEAGDAARALGLIDDHLASAVRDLTAGKDGGDS
jgi:DNA-binding GntR family transcriptional regulator